jgi:hypothetical protein
MKAGARLKVTTDTKPIETRQREDGTLEVWTTDADPWLAETRAADDVRLAGVLADFRSRGHARPVRLVLCNDSPAAVSLHARLRLPASAVPLHLRSDCLIGFVLTVAEAREVLHPVFGEEVARLFQRTSWPVSFWEVHVMSIGTRVYETRTWQDARNDG